MKTPTELADLLALHVIALTLKVRGTERTVYLAKERDGMPATWDGTWYTEQVSEAKTYKLARNAEKRIAEHTIGWADLSPRVTTVGAAS